MQDKIEKGSNLVAIYNMPSNSSLSKLSHENWKGCGKEPLSSVPRSHFTRTKGRRRRVCGCLGINSNQLPRKAADVFRRAWHHVVNSWVSSIKA